MKLGISIKLDVTKIDKNRLFKGQKGTYLDLTTFVDTDNPGQYGDHGFISQSVSKEEREQNVQTPILGNVMVFYQDFDAHNQQNMRDKPGRGTQNNGYQQNPAVNKAQSDFGGQVVDSGDIPF